MHRVFPFNIEELNEGDNCDHSSNVSRTLFPVTWTLSVALGSKKEMPSRIVPDH
jgi:hypothetical protein